MANYLINCNIGSVGNSPNIYKYYTGDDYDTITAENYISPIAAEYGYTLATGDIIVTVYDNASLGAIFSPVFSGANVTMIAIAGTNVSNVTGANLGSGHGVWASTINDVLNFKSLDAGTGMTITNTGTDITITNNGVLGATNLTGDQGLFTSVASNDIQLKSLSAGTGVTLSSSGTAVTIANNGVLGATNLGGTGLFTSVASNDIQLKGLSAGTGIAIASGSTTLTISATGYPVYVDAIAGFAALGTAGKVNVVVHSSGTAQYKVREIMLNLVGTDFSTGDRDLALTDGTSVYTVIPGASLQALANDRWGGTNVPFAVSVSLDTSTVAGADLYLQYSGGTSDYTAGSVTVTVGYEQVTV